MIDCEHDYDSKQMWELDFPYIVVTCKRCGHEFILPNSILKEMDINHDYKILPNEAFSVKKISKRKEI